MRLYDRWTFFSEVLRLANLPLVGALSLLSEEELASLPELPVERLLTLALTHHMIDEGRLEEEGLVHIYAGSRELLLEREEGTVFLRELIRGCDRASRLE